MSPLRKLILPQGRKESAKIAKNKHFVINILRPLRKFRLLSLWSLSLRLVSLSNHRNVEICAFAVNKVSGLSYSVIHF